MSSITSSEIIKNRFKAIFALPIEGRVFGLDFMRAIAILGVLLTHAQLVLPANERGWLGTFASFSGTLGVELFFVLSGFLIGSILLSLAPRFHEIRTLPYFWQRRWLRTIPNYFLFLLANILAAVLVARAIPNLLLYMSFTQNFLWPHPSFFDQAWSLTIEEWFYLLFPISLYLLYRLFKSFDVAFIVSAGIFLVIPTAIRINWAVTTNLDWDTYFRKIMLLRLDSIMYGVLAAWIKKNSPTFWKKYRWPLIIFGLLIVTVSWSWVLIRGVDADFFGKTFLFSCTSLGFACLLPALDQWKLQHETIASTTTRLIALWSYSLYLCNLLVAQIFMLINEKISGIPFSIGILFFAAFFVISFAVSAMVYSFFEKPILDLRNRFSIS